MAVPTNYKWELKLNTRGSNTAPYWGFANNNTYSSATSFYSLGANGTAGISGIALSIGAFSGTPETDQKSFYNADDITSAETLGGDTPHTIKCDGGFVFTADDTPMVQSVAKTFDAFTPTGTAYLFARHVPSMTADMIAKSGVRIYSYKVWDNNDSIVRNFVPALDGNDTPCLYDKVEGKFYYNAGTGNFIAGPIISE